MREFMKRGKRPRRPRVPIIDDDEWRNRVRDGKAAERFYRYVCVMAAEIAQQQHENPRRFDCPAEVSKCIRRLGGPTELLKRELQALRDALCQILYRLLQGCRRYKIDGWRFDFFLHRA